MRLLRRGVMIRHLVLPGQIENTRAALFWIADTFAPGTVLVSLMAQYTPCGHLDKYPELRRTLTPEEWDAALKYDPSSAELPARRDLARLRMKEADPVGLCEAATKLDAALSTARTITLFEGNTVTIQPETGFTAVQP